MTPPSPALASRARELRLFDGGRAAFDEVLQRVDRADNTIEVRAFLWRDDETGNQLARALLRAAERGVRVTIHKDAIAAVYEHSGGNKQSFFHKRLDPVRRTQAWLLRTVYLNWGRVRQQTNPLRDALLAHPLVTVEHQAKRFDHSKLFIFDGRSMVLGSFGIGNDHRFAWLEMVVAVEGPSHVARLRDRLAGVADFDPTRRVDFLLHARQTHGRGTCPMLDERLQLIASARRSVVVEMAYLGDRRFTDALVAAVDRGVQVTLLTADRADILGDLNRAVGDEILRRTAAPDRLRIFLHPQMVHTKAVVIDERISDIGSANFTPLSHGVYDEINLYVNDTGFSRELADAIHANCTEARAVEGRIGYRALVVHVERAISAYQARHGG